MQWDSIGAFRSVQDTILSPISRVMSNDNSSIGSSPMLSEQDTGYGTRSPDGGQAARSVIRSIMSEDCSPVKQKKETGWVWVLLRGTPICYPNILILKSVWTCGAGWRGIDDIPVRYAALQQPPGENGSCCRMM